MLVRAGRFVRRGSSPSRDRAQDCDEKVVLPSVTEIFRLQMLEFLCLFKFVPKKGIGVFPSENGIVLHSQLPGFV